MKRRHQRLLLLKRLRDTERGDKMKVIWEPGLQIEKMCSSAESAIVAVNVRQYIDFLGGKWRNHFVTKRQLFAAKELSTNNGNFKTLASNGRLELFNAVTDEVEKAKNFLYNIYNMQTVLLSYNSAY
jgi:hypothetical protein